MKTIRNRIVTLGITLCSLNACQHREIGFPILKGEHLYFKKSESIDSTEHGITAFESYNQAFSSLVNLNQELCFCLLSYEDSTFYCFNDEGELEFEVLMCDSQENLKLGEWLNLVSVGHDSSLMIYEKGAELYTKDGLSQVYLLSRWLPQNYYFVRFTNAQLARNGNRIRLTIGGEWEYPKKRYPSDMRFLVEIDLKNPEINILPSVNPDFGENYPVISQTNLSLLGDRLVVRYGSVPMIYEAKAGSG